jgi:hypothetical protein
MTSRSVISTTKKRGGLVEKVGRALDIAQFRDRMGQEEKAAGNANGGSCID